VPRREAASHQKLGYERTLGDKNKYSFNVSINIVCPSLIRLGLFGIPSKCLVANKEEQATNEKQNHQNCSVVFDSTLCGTDGKKKKEM
jgi:hypothetical protein